MYHNETFFSRCRSLGLQAYVPLETVGMPTLGLSGATHTNGAHLYTKLVVRPFLQRNVASHTRITGEQ
jgi:hypothetical protein